MKLAAGQGLVRAQEALVHVQLGLMFKNQAECGQLREEVARVNALGGADSDAVVSGLQAEIAMKAQEVERVRVELEAQAASAESAAEPINSWKRRRKARARKRTRRWSMFRQTFKL